MKVSNFELLSLDAGLDLLQSKVDTLSQQKLSAFFGVIGVVMLPFYVQFHEMNHWGDPRVLRDALDGALSYASGRLEPHGNVNNIVNAISAVIPDEEKFEVPQSTFAINAAICADAAIRASTSGYKVESAWIEYALDPVITVLCERQTGYLNLGSSAEANVWQATALKNPELKTAFEAVEKMLELLLELEIPINKEHLAALEQLAQQLVPSNLHRSP